jgi:hypothetical protein
MTFADIFSEVLNAFNSNNVNYMVVGGYAVNFHGYERNTSDLDIWVKPSKDNLNLVVQALSKLGFEQDALNHIAYFNPSEPFLFHIGTEPDDIEVFNFVTGVKYEEAEPHKVPFLDSNGLQVYFISIRDLLVNKMLAGRSQDKLDVEMLQRIQDLK